MKRLLLAFVVVVAAVATTAGWLWHQYGHAPLAMADSPTIVTIARGSGAIGIARQLRAAGVDVEPLMLRAALRMRGDGGRMQAGTYRIEAGTTLEHLLDRLVAGDVVFEELRIGEGWNFRQLRAAIDAHPELAHDSRDLTEAELLERLGLPYEHAEGLFFPSTYRFARGTSDFEVLGQAAELMRRHIDAAWEQRAPELPLADPYEMLILASMIEKETGLAEDRRRVAGVFVNRLRIGMLLQSDPTTIYGMGESFDGNLRRRDLRTDTPHNTYTRPGLPPTPIAMPGEASLLAAVTPAETRELYFVSRGDGSSQFSENLDAHNRAVREFQLRRRAPVGESR
ncbi:MAG: endolytic transglycosylase MltG [Burkholderiaceae bacterium]